MKTFSRITIAILLLSVTYASAAATEKVLYNFSIGTTGADRSPIYPLVFDSAGNLYGATGLNGAFESEVFQLAPNTDGTWSENILYLFPQTFVQPSTPLLIDSAGNLYGGSLYGKSGAGFLFELSDTGGSWQPSNIHNFEYADGSYPDSLAFGPDGDIYGLADYGGGSSGNCDQSSCGTVYRLIKQTDGTWKIQLIHSFTGGADGGNPVPIGAVAFGSSGQIYVASQVAGKGGGQIIEFAPVGTGWREKVLLEFDTAGFKGGSFPQQGLAIDSAGNLYGTTNGGGSAGFGLIYELSPGASGKWKETVLYNFQGGNDGSAPIGPVTFDAAGNLYGTTNTGGTSGKGTVWELYPGTSGWTETVLHDFAGGVSDGANPQGGVILDSAGNLYGVTPTGGTSGYGVAYEVIP
jgi:uncharacterized repeat protein (TIGR03803 family)